MSFESLSPSPNGHKSFPQKSERPNSGQDLHHLAKCMTPEQMQRGRTLGILRSQHARLLRKIQKLIEHLNQIRGKLDLPVVPVNWFDSTSPPVELVSYPHRESVLERDTSLSQEEEKTEKPPFRESSPRAQARARKRLEDPGPPEFQSFYAAYPRHIAREKALKAWRDLEPSSDLQARIMTAVAAQTAVNFAGPDAPTIPYPASWLNGERWTDEIKPPKPRPKTQADVIRDWVRDKTERIHRHESARSGDDNPDSWAPRLGLPGPRDDA